MKFKFLLLIIAFKPFFALSQYDSFDVSKKGVIPENITILKPDVELFHKIDFLKTNNYSGSANIEVPIHTIKFGKLTIPLSLSYNTTGVKVDDPGTIVGVNWSLNCGGSIFREIKDLPDNELSFTAGYYEHYGDAMIRPALTQEGYNRRGGKPLQTSLTWSSHPTLNHTHQATYTEDMNNNENLNSYLDWGYYQKHKDIYPDIFKLSAPGISTSFIVVNNSLTEDVFPNNNELNTTFLDNQGHMMIEKSFERFNNQGLGFIQEFGINLIYPNTSNHYSKDNMPIKDFVKFSILSNEGYQYNFQDYEIHESFFFPYYEIINNPFFGATKAVAAMTSNNYNKRITNWNLSSIIDKSTGSELLYEYESYINNNMQFLNSTTKLVKNNLANHTYNSNNCDYGLFSEPENGFSNTYETVKKLNLGRRLKRIKYPYGEIQFYYEDRSDYIGEKYLKYIKITEGTNSFFIDFNYDIVTSVNEDPDSQLSKRLFLKSITKRVNELSAMIASFNYNSPDMLPRKGSLQQDYFGFYNKNGIVDHQGFNNYYTPKLYFYKNNKENSLLPFKRIDTVGIDIEGQLDLQPNSNNLYGLLTSINYHTGGSNSITYEPNTFVYKNNEYIGPGSRILQQILVNNNSDTVVKNYYYSNENGMSSGYINNIPTYGYIQKLNNTIDNFQYFVTYDKPKTNLEYTAGNYIGYGRVSEVISGKGKTIYEYYTPNDFPNLKEKLSATTLCEIKLLENSAFGFFGNTLANSRQGKIKSIKYYNIDDIELLQEKFTYIDEHKNKLNFSGYHEIQNKARERDPSDVFKLSVQGVFEFSNFNIIQKDVINTFNPIKTTFTEKYKYDRFGFLKEIYSNKSDGTLKTTKYYRINDSLENNYNPKLLIDNRISEVLAQKKFYSQNLVATDSIKYIFFQGNYLPSEYITSIGNSNKITKSIIERNSNGDILTYKDSNGKFTTYIWGYNGQFPISKIENATYGEVKTILTDAVINSLNSSSIADITILNTIEILRRHPNMQKAQVWTFTYNPFSGMSSETDPRGVITKYTYDGLHRLNEILDFENNILKNYQYNYRSQQTF